MTVPLLVAAGLVAIGLVVVLQVRVTQRQQALEREVTRLKGVHRDMATDVRVRLEEARALLDTVEGEVRPKVEALEASLADVSASLDENLPALRDGRQRLERMEDDVAALEARVAAALETGGREAAETLDRVAAEGEAARAGLEARLAAVLARMDALEEGVGAAVPDAPLAAVLARVDALEEEARTRAEETLDPEDADREGRLPSSGPRGTRGDGGARWLLLLLVLAGGLALIVVSLAY